MFAKTKTKIMKKLICSACFIALSLTSCSSGGDSSTSSESDVLVTKTAETYANDGSVITTNYTYNGKKMVKATDSDGYYETYTYTGDLLTRVNYLSDLDELEETETFTYNANNKLVSYVRAELFDDSGVKETFVYNSNGTISTTTYSGDATSQTNVLNTSLINFSGGEVSVTQLFSGSTLVSTHTYTYDTKNSPFQNVTGYDKIAVLEVESVGLNHNILTDSYNEFGNNYITTSVYTYNSLNFPLTNAETEGTDATSTITTQYTYN